jgi:23S rRNA (cytosine1962-C5)-methyltransferase
MIKVQLGKKKGYRVEAGHPWVYDNEIESVSEELKAGDVAEVYNFKNQFIGRGIANPKSHILVRLFTRDFKEDVNATLFRNRILAAWEYRKAIGYTENCRLVFSEADFLPGLVIDKFGDYFSVQILSYAVDIHKETIFKTLNDIFKPKGIFERNDAPVREREGLPVQKGFVSAPFDPMITITEPENVKFFVDLEKGQKTGFFLDQKENRLSIAPFVKNANVLECFCYTGSFALYAGRFGAKSVLGLDQSEDAIAMAKKNATLNGLDSVCEFQAVNAFDALNLWAREKKQFDTVLLDPPAFTKNRAGLEGAIRGYKDINLRAMQIVKPGGFLITSSCSHFMTPELFKEVIFEASVDAKRSVRQVLYQTQAKDHPVLWGVDESLYLKFLVLHVV